MTASSQQHWRQEFAIAEREAPGFVSSSGELDSVPNPLPQAHTLRRAFDTMRVDGVFCSQNIPVVYFKEVPRILPAQVRSLQRRFWSQGVAPLLVLIAPRDVHIYSSLATPPKDDEPVDSGDRLIESLNRVTDAAKLREFVLSVESGEYFRRHLKSFDPKQRVDRNLLRSLKATREVLTDVSSSRLQKNPQVLDALVCRVIFSCYLFDRNIIDEVYLDEINVGGSKNLRDVVKRPESEAKDSLYSLFRQLSKDFNGDLFSSDLDAEVEQITGKHLNVLTDFLEGTDVRSGQRSFWPYDFGVIPIETISFIYEHFLKAADPEGKKKSGAFYTPRFLAEIVLDTALDGVGPLLDKRFLDPACGSGIFLVGLFNRLAEEWRRTNPTARYDRRASGLMDILRNNLFGVDENPTACRITAFSLYLAFLDQLSPPDIRRLQRAGKMLPHLVVDEESDSAVPEERTILRSDFFANRSEIPDDCHVIVGNPPWESIEGEKLPAEKWCDERNLNVPNRQLAVPFIWKAAEHQCAGGRICFVLPHGVLFNHQRKAIVFQRQWLEQHTIDFVMNLADLRFNLFESAVGPALVIRYRSESPRGNHVCTKYLSPKTNWNVSQVEVLSVDPVDHREIDCRMVLSDLRKSNVSTLWKERFWGTPRDWKLLDRLASLPPLKTHVGQAKDRVPKRWRIAEGFQPLGPSDDDSRFKSRPWTDSHLFLEGTASAIDLMVIAYDCKPIGKRFSKLRRLPMMEIFEAPHVLVTKGLRVAYCDFDVAFRHAVRGIHGTTEDRSLLVFLAAYLRSPLARYFLFHTSGRWGIERSEVQVAELLRVPFPLPEQTNDANRAEKVIEQARERMECALAGVCQPLADRSHIIRSAQLELNELVYEYFEVDEVERILIEDTANFTIPSILPNRASDDIPTLKLADATSRNRYLDTLCSKINDWARGGSYQVQGHAVISDECGHAIVAIDRTTNGNKCGRDGSLTEFSAVLSRLREVFKKQTGSVEIVRGVKVFDGNRLYYLKPLGQRFWTQTAALNDADEVAAEILSRRRGGKS